jgi:hypothetical protein
MCDARMLLHALPTHSPELPRFIGRDVRWALRVNLSHFLDVCNPKIVYWDFHVNLSLNNLCLLKEEKTPIAMSTNSFPEIVNFLGV